MPEFNVGLLFGPMLIGTFLNAILYGVVIVQTFIYYQTYKRDATWIRYFVLYLLIVETLNTAFAIGMMYEPLILRYGSEHAVQFLPLMLPAEPIVTVAISTPVQIFIAWRILVISGSKLLSGVIILMALVAMAGGVWTAVGVAVGKVYAVIPQNHAPSLTWLVTSAVADVLITCALTFSLYRRKTGVSSTDTLVNRIIRLTLQTGLITAICAVVDVILIMGSVDTTLFFIWDYSLSKLYANALISTLNARVGWDHLANGDAANNVLFGGSHGVPSKAPRIGTLGASTTAGNEVRFARNGSTITGVYELNSVAQSTTKPGDPEYGISVTKEVNRIEDPVKYSTQ